MQEEDGAGLAKIALFEFILGESVNIQVMAFNKILCRLGIQTELSVDEACNFCWKHCSYNDQYLAEKLFNDIASSFSTKEAKEKAQACQADLVVQQYRKIIKDIGDKVVFPISIC